MNSQDNFHQNHKFKNNYKIIYYFLVLNKYNRLQLKMNKQKILLLFLKDYIIINNKYLIIKKNIMKLIILKILK